MHNLIARTLYFTAQGVRQEPVLPVMRELARSERWSPERLREQQWTLQVRLARHAYETVPYYRSRWRAMGFTPDQLRTPDDWTRLPVLEKRDLQVYGDELRSTKRTAGVPASTSGSSGTPLTVHRSHRSWAHAHANVFRGWRWHGLGVGDPYALFWGQTLNEADRRRTVVRDWLFNRRRVSAFTLDPTRARAHFMRLRKQPVRFAFGYPSALSHFADEIECLGLDGRELGWRVVITSAETLRAHQRERLAATFGCPVVDSYGCAEVGVTGFECPGGSMHVPVESVVVETVPCPDGDYEILLTDLHNEVQPLIRYRIGDLAVMGAEPVAGRSDCACGLGLPTMGPTLGRRGDMITLPDGRRVNPNLPSYIFKRYGQSGTIREYQFVQDVHDRIELRILRGPAWSPSVQEQLAEDVWRTLGVQVPVRLVPKFERNGRGKHRDIARIDGALPECSPAIETYADAAS